LQVVKLLRLLFDFTLGRCQLLLLLFLQKVWYASVRSPSGAFATNQS
jgi:hypothetical protein